MTTIEEALYQAEDDYANMLEKTLANEVIRLRELATDCEALRLMTAERDRYKNALTRIATIRLKGYEAQRIAREAIKDKKP
jgi:hypothetical protein